MEQNNQLFMYLIKLFLIVSISYFVITKLNLIEKFSDVKSQSGNNNMSRYPKCLSKSDIGLKLFYLLEKNGKLNQTVLPYVYNLMICFSNEINKFGYSPELVDKYLKRIKNTGYKFTSKDIYQVVYKIIERETELLELHPDDVVQLIKINNQFYKSLGYKNLIN